jgi:hypothetical protein
MTACLFVVVPVSKGSSGPLAAFGAKDGVFLGRGSASCFPRYLPAHGVSDNVSSASKYRVGLLIVDGPGVLKRDETVRPSPFSLFFKVEISDVVEVFVVAESP